MKKTLLITSTALMVVATALLATPVHAFRCASSDGSAVCNCRDACAWGTDFCECILYTK